MIVGCADRASLGLYDESTSVDDVLSSDASSEASNTSGGNDVPAMRCPEGRDCGGSCPEGCGRLESPYDANGCVRALCAGDNECSADERCFVAAEFGLCEPTGLTCDRTNGEQCTCTDDGTCDGGHCVSVDLWPVEEESPGLGALHLELGCGPTDGAALVFWAGGEAGSGCEVSLPSDPELVMFFDVSGEAPYELSTQMGRYRGVDGMAEDVWLGRLQLDDLIDPSVTGTLQWYVPDGGVVHAFELDFVNATLCGPMHSCP